MHRNIKIFLLAQIFTGLLFTIPIWVAFEQRFFTYSQMALLEVLAFSITTIFEIPTGALADLIGRRATIIAGFIICGFGYIYLGYTTAAIQLIVGFSIVAVGAALISGSDIALVYDSLKALGRESDFSSIIAKKVVLYRSAITIATFFSGYLYQLYIGLPYILRGSAQLIGALIYFMAVEPTTPRAKFGLSNYLSQLKQGYNQLTKNSHTLTLSFYYILVASFSWSCLYYFMNAYAKDSGYTEIEQSWAISAIYVITTTVILLHAKYKNKISKDAILLLFPVIMLLSYIPGIWANKIVSFFLMLGITQVGGARFSILDLYINELFSSENRATVLSTLNMGVSVLFIMIVTIGGFIQNALSTKYMWSFLGLLTLVVLIPITYKLRLLEKNKGTLLENPL